MPRRRAIARLPGANLGGGLLDRRLHEFVGGGGSRATAERAIFWNRSPFWLILNPLRSRSCFLRAAIDFFPP
jgi:hypothetical protein